MLKLIILGIVQGLTEFLPVSSSGHLVLTQKIIGLPGEEIATSLILHMGTILALLIFFYRDILKIFRDRHMILMIAVVTFVTGVIGIIGKKFFESTFASTSWLVAGWFITAVVLISTKYFSQGKKGKVNSLDALIMGFAQGASILPSISRSGATVAALLFRGLKREEAFKFSFLASIPAIAGAALLESKDMVFSFQGHALDYIAGFIASLLCGIFSLWLLRLVIRKAKLYYFGYYCAVIAVLTLIFIK